MAVQPRADAMRSVAIVLGAAVPAAAVLAVGGPVAAVLVVGVIGVGLATVFAPGAILAMLVLVPFYKGAAQQYVPVDITVLFALLNAIQVVPLLRDRRRINRSTVGLTLWGALALLLIAGIIYAPDQRLAISQVSTFVALLLVPTLPAALRVGGDERYVRQFLMVVFGLGVLTVILGLQAMSRTERLLVLGTDTISVSRAALLVPIVGLVFVVQHAHRWVQALMAILIPLAMIVAVASGSRGPLLVATLMAVGGAIVFFARGGTIDRRVLRVVALLTIASVVILAVAAPALPTSSLERFTLLASFAQDEVLGEGTAGGDRSSGARLDLFGAAWQMFTDRPVLGYGTGGFETISKDILGPGQPNAYPHNAVLQLAAEFGLVGLVLFAGLIFVGVGRSIPRRPSSSALRALFVFFLLNAMVSGDIFDDRMTWGLLILIFSLHGAGQPAPAVAATGATGARLTAPAPLPLTE